MNHDIDPRSLLPINQRRQRTTYSPDADPNEIIGWRNTSRRTSWRNRHLSLNVNDQRELRLLRSWYNNLIDLLPTATTHCYTLFLTLFLASKKNPHLRSLFQNGRISLMIDLLSSSIITPILQEIDDVRANFMQRIANFRHELPRQIESNPVPINRSIESLR